jgi:hypothetical protein
MDTKKIDKLLRKREQQRKEREKLNPPGRHKVLAEVRALNLVLKARLRPSDRIEIGELILTQGGVRLRRFHMSYLINHKLNPKRVAELADKWDELENRVLTWLKQLVGEGERN